MESIKIEKASTEKLSAPLRPKDLEEPQEQMEGEPAPAVSTFWHETLPIVLDVACLFTQKKFPNGTEALREAQPALIESAGHLLDKYAPISVGGATDDIPHILALGICGLSIGKGFQKDLKGGDLNERGHSKPIGRNVNKQLLTDSGSERNISKNAKHQENDDK